jgi:hypothetical protein
MAHSPTRNEIVTDECRSHGSTFMLMAKNIAGVKDGRAEELPRVDFGCNWRKLGIEARAQVLGRITCFVICRLGLRSPAHRLSK